MLQKAIRKLAGGLACCAGAAALAAALACLPGQWALYGALLCCDPAAVQAVWKGAAATAVQRPATLPSAATPQPTPRPQQGGSVRPTAAPAGTPTPVPTPTPTPRATPEPPPTDAPPDLQDPGLIVAQKFAQGSGEGFISLGAGTIRNLTAHPDADLAAAVSTPDLPFAVEPHSEEPQVLILHTHATETYQIWSQPVFDPAFTARTTNTALNMCAVGEAMAQELNAAGIATLHDTTLHDSPSYTESYDRSAATAKDYLARYPSIKVVLDVHRDAIEREDGSRIKPLCRIAGEDTAQVMLIAGCDNGASVLLPNWRLNLRFAAAWQQAMEQRYPGLTRPVLCAYRYYNQDLSTGSLLVEVGGHANTLQEALRAGRYAARALAELLGGTPAVQQDAAQPTGQPNGTN